MSDRGSDPQGEIRAHVFGRTDVGQVREHNEDNFLVADLTRQTRSLMESDRFQVVGKRGSLLGVCDGMGGAAAGEVASQIAVDMIFEKLAFADVPEDHDALARRLVRAVEEAGVRIFTEARADRTRRGMGTTATIAALVDARLFLAQVGDSRCYVLRDGKMVQVTRDQSLVNQLIEAGQLTEEEAETFEHNNIILQALGTAETVQVDLTYVDLCRGDTLLLCSDGLSGMIRGDEIREVLTTVQDPLEACKVLTERANLAGGHDNITVIVAHLDGPGLPEPGPSVPPLGYHKYALPELAQTDPPAPTNKETPDALTWPPSEEAEWEVRPLKVGQTLLGVPSPSPAVPAAPAAAKLPEIPASAPPPPAEFEDEPVYIPTTGLPPAVIGFMVVGSLILVAALGFFVLW
jgi:PPM family protein phosphatase